MRGEQLRENKEGTKTYKQVKEKRGDDSMIDPWTTIRGEKKNNQGMKNEIKRKK